MMAGAPIPRLHRPSREVFRRDYERRRRPLVITGALDGRAALRTWSFDHLAANGDVEVTVRVSPRGAPQLFDGNPGAAFEFRELSLRDALRGITHSSDEIWYVQHAELKALRRLHEEVGHFDYLPGRITPEPKLWVSGPNTKNPLHWDTHHAALAQISGEKRFWLFPPQDSSKLASFSHRTLWRTTALDLSAIDRARFPAIDQAHAWTCTVRPGDVLFIPYGYWHSMECDDPTISVTWWWPPSFAVHLRDSARERVSNWVKRALRAATPAASRSRGPTTRLPRSLRAE